MTLPIRDEPKDFRDVQQRLKDIKDRITLEDLNIGDVRTVAPTTSTFNKGKLTVVELSGVPWLYYLTTGNILYRIVMTAV